MTDSSHFYDKEGSPVFEVPNKSNGGMRKTTLADCKKLGLYPSCTTYLKILAKPELDNWKLRQVALAALTFPHKPDEDDNAFIDRIIVDAFEQVEDAADLGTRIHAALENHFQQRPYDESLKVYVEGVDAWSKEYGIQWLEHEVRLVNHEYGYAGTTDAKAIVQSNYFKLATIDFKSRKTKPEYECNPWATEPMQIAAYSKSAKTQMGCNVYISTTEPGRVECCWYDEEELERNWLAFTHIIKLWQHLNSYCPN